MPAMESRYWQGASGSDTIRAPRRKRRERHLGGRVIEPLREISTNTRRLSAYIAGALKQPLPPAILAKARQHILDTMAAMISGTRLPPGKLAIAYVTSLGGVRQARSE